MREMDARDKEEAKPGELGKEELKKVLDYLERRKVQLTNALKKIEESGGNQICTTDPECRVMKTRDGIRPSYNVQTAVEADNHIIVHYDVTDECVDWNLLKAGIAQEESRNISENVTWGMRKRFAEGKVMMPYGQFMGYRRGADGSPEIVEAEARIVRTIFRRLLEGATPAIIARELNNAEIPCPSRKGLLTDDAIEVEKARKKTARWSPSTVESILTNEKYKGDAILQKTYCTDYIRKTFVVNDGSEIPKYYAQNSHPAIVSAEVFDLTQMEPEWRRNLKGSYSGRSCFASRIVCGDCGSFYGSKVWHSTDAYRRTIWRCNNKYDGDRKCSTPHVTQKELERAFVIVMQKVLQDKEEILAACRAALDAAFDTTELDRAAKRLEEQVRGIAERVRKLVEENARVQMNQEEYQQEYNALAEDYEKVSEKLRKIAAQKQDMADRRRKIEIFLRMLERQEECLNFNPYTFVALVDKVVIGKDRKLEFHFRNGMQYFSSLDGVHAQ